MMESFLPQLILFLALFNVIILALADDDDTTFKSVFLFGDSLFDTGNNAFVNTCVVQANFPPYGSTFFNHPTGRFTNGRNVADFIVKQAARQLKHTAQYMGIDFQKPFQEVYQELSNNTIKDIPTNGINFGSGGSGVLRETNKIAGVTSIQVQLEQLQTLIDKDYLHKDQITNSLFFLESGSNDIFSYFLTPSTPNPPEKDYVDAMLKEVSDYIDKIYNIGALRIAIFSVGPNGCIPGRVLMHGPIDQCFDRINDMVKYYNDGLESLVMGIPSKYPNAVAVYGSVYDIILNFRSLPEIHGFANVNEACCGGGLLKGMLQCGLEGYTKCSNPNEFLFWDYFHPTEHTYELVSEALWTGDTNQMRPMNLKSFANITLPSS